MELIYYIFEYPFSGSLFFKVICIFFTITTICRRVPEKELICQLQQVPEGLQ